MVNTAARADPGVAISKFSFAATCTNDTARFAADLTSSRSFSLNRVLLFTAVSAPSAPGGATLAAHSCASVLRLSQSRRWAITAASSSTAWCLRVNKT